jgi:hypothetical protein
MVTIFLHPDDAYRLRVSGFPLLRVPFPKKSGTRLKNRFGVFLNTQMSGYSLSSIFE